MKRDLLSRYKLEKRLSKLESLLVERSVGRGGAPSKAYQIWDYLMNNGPKSVADLRAALPREVTNFINFYADNNLLNKDGDMISANANYAWDDVGVIPRTAQQELLNSIRDNEIDVPDRNASDDERKRLSDMNKRNTMIQKIVKAIEDDEWNRELEKAVTDSPEILRVDKISDAIDDNDTLTARQLKRRLA